MVNNSFKRTKELVRSKVNFKLSCSISILMAGMQPEWKMQIVSRDKTLPAQAVHHSHCITASITLQRITVSHFQTGVFHSPTPYIMVQNFQFSPFPQLKLGATLRPRLRAWLKYQLSSGTKCPLILLLHILWLSVLSQSTTYSYMKPWWATVNQNQSGYGPNSIKC